jgi:hypothetical protein
MLVTDRGGTTESLNTKRACMCTRKVFRLRGYRHQLARPHGTLDASAFLTPSHVPRPLILTHADSLAFSVGGLEAGAGGACSLPHSRPLAPLTYPQRID